MSEPKPNQNPVLENGSEFPLARSKRRRECHHAWQTRDLARKTPVLKLVVARQLERRLDVGRQRIQHGQTLRGLPPTVEGHRFAGRRQTTEYRAGRGERGERREQRTKSGVRSPESVLLRQSYGGQGSQEIRVRVGAGSPDFRRSSLLSLLSATPIAATARVGQPGRWRCPCSRVCGRAWQVAGRVSLPNKAGKRRSIA